MSNHTNHSSKYNCIDIRKEYNSGLSLRDLMKKFGMAKPPRGYWNKIYAGKIIPLSSSDLGLIPFKDKTRV